MSRKRLAGRFLRTTMLSGAAAAAALPAFAQDEDDTIIVTGTRIQREDLAAPSPVTTVSSEQLVLTNTVNTEQFLNTLPQVIPSLDQTSNNPGNGTATVNLRGLGTSRTLVLVDGARFAGQGPSFVVDLNNIPAALVERIDVVTGGASAVYGSDAVAGVVNFILKDDFEGVQLDVSHELSAAGWDANTTNVALTFGGNFADGRGNAVISGSYTNREALLQGDRDFSALTFRDPGQGNEADGFILAGSANIPGGGFFSPSFNNFGLNDGTNTNFVGQTVADVDPLCGAASTTCTGFRGSDGASINGFRFGVPAGQATDEYNYAPSNYLQLPQERYSLSGFASYEINDHIEAYMRGVFSEVVVDSQLAPTPAFLRLTVNNDNPSIPSTLLSLITGSTANNGDGTSTFFISKRYEELGTRNSLRDTTALQLLTGLRGDLNDTWSYDTYLNFTRSTNSQIQSGNISVSALQAALLCDGGPTAVASGCSEPYVDLFGGQGGISAEGAEFISRTGAIIQEVEQTQWVGTISGDLDGLRAPWADSGVALVLGAEYRELFANTVPDSVLGPDVRGFNQSAAVRGRYDVYEAFGEIIIPVITDRPFVESFQINGAYRYSDYSLSNVGGVHTFAIGGDWEVVPGMRLRSQFQRAVRAPNIGELFSPQTNNFPSATDPCSDDPDVAGTQLRPGVIASTCPGGGVVPQPFGQIQVLSGGNPNLTNEVGDTLTIGMVWQPEMVDGLTLQVDYYDIEVKNAVTTIGLQTVLDECHFQGIASQCAIINQGRDPSSGIAGVNGFFAPLGSINAATIQARGIDFNASYSMDVFNGTVTALYYGNYTLRSDLQSSASAALVECTGLFSGNCGEPTPDYKHTMQVSYIQGPLTASVRWRLIGGVDADPAAGAVSDLSDNIDLFNYLDVTTQYAVNENLDLTVGVRNITGKDAPLLGSTVNEQANTWPATYTPFGRQLFFGASVRF